MTTTTVKKIVKKAFQKAGILTKTQDPAADELNDAVDALNDMMESWANDSMLCIARATENFPLTANISAYTIGTGGAFNTVKPIDIISAFIRSGGIDYPVDVITDENYSDITFKTAGGIPDWLKFDNSFPLATITLYPVPYGGLNLYLLTEKPLTAYGINDSVILPPGWNRALIYNLSIEIGPDYGQEPSAETKQIAVDSKSLIQKGIIKNRSLDANPSSSQGSNIYTGWNR